MRHRSLGGGEDGYVLIALLASSSVLLAAMALAIPRMAMQAQRVKDSQLIERGEQYKRAIKLYFTAHGKYPREFSDLEETEGVRYLRRLYADPFAEDGEWRLIHMGTDGRFEDSRLFDLEEDRPGSQSGPAGSGLGGPGLGATAVGVAGLGFDSQGRQTAPAIPEQPLVDAMGNPLPVQRNQAAVARTTAAPDLTAARGRYNAGFGYDADQVERPTGDLEPTEESDYYMMLPSQVPMDENDPRRLAAMQRSLLEQNAMNAGGDPFAPGSQVGPDGQPFGAANQGTPSTANAMPLGGGQGSGGNVQVGSTALQMINRTLTTPRTDLGPGVGRGMALGVSGPTTFERGIAGVASKSEGQGVRQYSGKRSYAEWEFVFDYREEVDETGQSRGGMPSQNVPLSERSRRSGGFGATQAPSGFGRSGRSRNR